LSWGQPVPGGPEVRQRRWLQSGRWVLWGRWVRPALWDQRDHWRPGGQPSLPIRRVL